MVDVVFKECNFLTEPGWKRTDVVNDSCIANREATSNIKQYLFNCQHL
jgi:hypothetical protein